MVNISTYDTSLNSFSIVHLFLLLTTTSVVDITPTLKTSYSELKNTRDLTDTA